MKARTFTLIVLQFTLLAVSCRGAEAPTAPVGELDSETAPVGYLMEPNIQYGAGPTRNGPIPLLLDLYQPKQACTTPRPTMMYVHGGAFQNGSKRSGIVAAFAEELAPLGINLISIDYRLTRDEAVISPEFAQFAADYAALVPTETPEKMNAFAAAVEDAVRALRWMQTNGSRYCIDPTRIGLWGGSAGSYTVMHVAYALNAYGIARPTPRVVVDHWGALARDTDLEAGEAPLFVLHGTSDDVVVYSEAIELTERAKRVGVPYSFYTVTDGEHDYSGIGYASLSLNGQSMLRTTAQFVNIHLRGSTPTYETRVIPLPR
jgi:acetyl esterase/lipase